MRQDGHGLSSPPVATTGPGCPGDPRARGGWSSPVSIRATISTGAVKARDSGADAQKAAEFSLRTSAFGVEWPGALAERLPAPGQGGGIVVRDAHGAVARQREVRVTAGDLLEVRS